MEGDRLFATVYPFRRRLRSAYYFFHEGNRRKFIWKNAEFVFLIFSMKQLIWCRQTDESGILMCERYAKQLDKYGKKDIMKKELFSE